MIAPEPHPAAEEIRNLLANGKTTEAIAKAKGWIEGVEFQQRLVLLQTQFQDIARKYNLGTLSSSEFQLQNGRVGSNLLEIVSAWEQIAQNDTTPEPNARTGYEQTQETPISTENVYSNNPVQESSANYDAPTSESTAEESQAPYLDLLAKMRSKITPNSSAEQRSLIETQLGKSVAQLKVFQSKLSDEKKKNIEIADHFPTDSAEFVPPRTRTLLTSGSFWRTIGMIWIGLLFLGFWFFNPKVKQEENWFQFGTARESEKVYPSSDEDVLTMLTHFCAVAIEKNGSDSLNHVYFGAESQKFERLHRQFENIHRGKEKMHAESGNQAKDDHAEIATKDLISIAQTWSREHELDSTNLLKNVAIAYYNRAIRSYNSNQTETSCGLFLEANTFAGEIKNPSASDLELVTKIKSDYTRNCSEENDNYGKNMNQQPIPRKSKNKNEYNQAPASAQPPKQESNGETDKIESEIRRIEQDEKEMSRNPKENAGALEKLRYRKEELRRRAYPHSNKQSPKESAF